MNVFPPIIVRAQEPEALRRWANLEGKSPAMSNDLLHRHMTPPERQDSGMMTSLIQFGELAALVIEAVRSIRTR
ncbi:MAG: hypothetical protein WD738_00030 [Pirellulales bacterium]